MQDARNLVFRWMEVTGASVIRHRLCPVLLLLTLACIGLTAQNFPARGFLPGNTFDLSQTEDINLVSGNMIVRAPLYKFPPGPAGQSMEIGLVYNSFIYDELPTANPDFPV